MVAQRAPRFLVRETDYGCAYTCFRNTDDGQHYHRTMHWLFPFYTMSPVPKLGSTAQFAATVPVDDYHNMQWSMTKVFEAPPARRGVQSTNIGTLPNTSDWLGRFRNPLDPTTDFGLDREIQRQKPTNITGFTGLAAVGVQDEAMKWSQGRMAGGLVDRSREHLGTTDAMIIRVRRRLLESAKALRENGAVPPALETPGVYRLRSGWVILPTDVDWWEASRHLREAFKGQAVAQAESGS
jgi:hypothetical protein